ncbi:MAG: hypothetical protein HY347_04465 [candidate division NC10 bacterium]|nr:hypothetical protein [candidate division NC10 bacterium]
MHPYVTIPSPDGQGQTTLAPTIPALPLLPTLIDELGQVRTHLKALEAQEKALTKQVKVLLSHNGGKAEGHAFKATLYQSERLTIDPVAFSDLVPEPAFWQSITVNTAKAKQHVGEATLKAMSTVQVVEGLRVEPRQWEPEGRPVRSRCLASGEIGRPGAV